MLNQHRNTGVFDTIIQVVNVSTQLLRNNVIRRWHKIIRYSHTSLAVALIKMSARDVKSETKHPCNQEQSS